MRGTLLRAFGLLLALTTAAAAQDYPTKAVRLIIPFAPGGSVDIVARLVAAKLSDRLGQQVIPDNRRRRRRHHRDGAGREGAGRRLHDRAGVAGACRQSRRSTSSTTIRSGSVAFVASLGNGASVLTVHPSVPAHSVKELIALAKSKPGDYAFAHAGVGSFTHTASVLFAMMAGIDVVQVPFKGGGPAMIDVMGGHSHLLMNSYLASVPHIRSGKLRPLGVSDTQADAAPARGADDRRGRRAGLSGGELVGHRGAGRHAAADRRKAAHGEINAVLDADEVKKQFDTDGAVIVRMTPAEFGKFFEAEIEKWGKVVKEANIKAE